MWKVTVLATVSHSDQSLGSGCSMEWSYVVTSAGLRGAGTNDLICRPPMLTLYSGRLVTCVDGHSLATFTVAVTSRSVTSTSSCWMSVKSESASPSGSSAEAVGEVGGASMGRRPTVPE